MRFDTRIEDNKAIAKVTHFSTFVLLDKEKVVVMPTPTTPPPTKLPTAEPTAAPTEDVPGFKAVFAKTFTKNASPLQVR